MSSNNMVTLSVSVPSEMADMFDEFVVTKYGEERGTTATALREVIANAIGFDLAPFYNAKKAEKRAKEVQKELNKAIVTRIGELVKEGQSFESIAKMLGLSNVA